MSLEISLSPDEIDALADEIADTAAHIDAATHRLLTQIRTFDQAGGWHVHGALSCAHWLSWRVGLSLGAAREKLRVAHRLAELSLVDEALRTGQLSFSKARAITRVATPDNEETLLEMARYSTAAQLEKICRLYRPVQAQDADEKGEIDDRRRYLTSRNTDDGMVSIQVRLFPEEAARVLEAADREAGSGDRVDGVVALADAALAGKVGTTEAVKPPVEVVVHVCAETLEGATERGDGVSAETCRRLLCDAGVVPMLEDAEGKTIDVGRKTRTIPAALRRALMARDGGCTFPGCTNHRYVDAHHIQHWMDGGKTNLRNTALACRRHHRYLHECGFSLQMGDGGPVFLTPRGNPIPKAPPRPRLPDGAYDRMDRRLRTDGITINPLTNEPMWDGLPVDYDACIDVLSRSDKLT